MASARLAPGQENQVGAGGAVGSGLLSRKPRAPAQSGCRQDSGPHENILQWAIPEKEIVTFISTLKTKYSIDVSFNN